MKKQKPVNFRPHEARKPEVSMREVERIYKAINVEPARTDKGDRFNNYVCHSLNCKRVMKTVDIHYGVTPMIIQCDTCGGSAQSTFYTDKIPDKKPEYEWRVPTLEEMYKYRDNPGMLEHIKRGGLELFKIKKPFISREEGARIRQERNSK